MIKKMLKVGNLILSSSHIPACIFCQHMSKSVSKIDVSYALLTNSNPSLRMQSSRASRSIFSPRIVYPRWTVPVHQRPGGMDHGRDLARTDPTGDHGAPSTVLPSNKPLPTTLAFDKRLNHLSTFVKLFILL